MSLIEGLLNQEVTAYSISTDGYGDRTRTQVYSSLPCRWQEKINKIVNQAGEEVVSSVEMWISSDYTVSETYEIKYGSEYYIIVAKQSGIDLDGNIDHYKIYLK